MDEQSVFVNVVDEGVAAGVGVLATLGVAGLLMYLVVAASGSFATLLVAAVGLVALCMSARVTWSLGAGFLKVWRGSRRAA